MDIAIASGNLQVEKYKRIWMKTSEWDPLVKDQSIVTTNWHGTVACAFQCSEKNDCSGFLHDDQLGIFEFFELIRICNNIELLQSQALVERELSGSSAL